MRLRLLLLRLLIWLVLLLYMPRFLLILVLMRLDVGATTGPAVAIDGGLLVRCGLLLAACCWWHLSDVRMLLDACWSLRLVMFVFGGLLAAARWTLLDTCSLGLIVCSLLPLVLTLLRCS